MLVLGVPARALAQASVPLDSFWVTDGPVYAITESAGTVYLGGGFTYVGPRTGNLARLDAATGAPDPAFPKVEGRVYAIAPDGVGGWYLGGAFVSVGGAPRRSLAHVLADGRVSSWNPNPSVNATVLTVAVSGRSVYVGGSFTTIGAAARSNIAAIDAASGLVTGWNPNANGIVDEIVVDSSLVYAGGSFTSIGGSLRSRLAALDPATGLATAWNPNVNGSISAMALGGTTLYVAGSFSQIGGQPRGNIGAVSTLTGAPTSFNPGANSLVMALRLQGTTLYAGGIFTTIGGAARANIAAIDTTLDTNNATAWNPGADQVVYALAASGPTLYAGGDFATIGGQPRLRLAALDTTLATNNATAWNPGANSTVDVILPDGANVYVGGALSSAGGQQRGRVAALDVATGAATAFNPGADAEVRALAVSGGRVFAGGLFASIGGQPRARIAALDAISGTAVAGWNPGANNNVLALDVGGGRVYAGGLFSVAGGSGRFDLAAFDEVTGALTGWNPIPTVTSGVNALKVSGGSVYVGGNFDYGGRMRIVELDAATALPTAWNPGANNNVYELALTASLVYAAGDFTTAGGAARNRLASISRATGTATAWNPNSSGGVYSVAVGGGSIFAGGPFTIMGGSGTRNRLAGFDEATGALSAWDPNADATVEVVALGASRVYAGGSFFKIGPRQFRGFAAFCLAGAPTGLVANPVGPNQIALAWTGSSPTYAVYRSLTPGGPYTPLATTAVPSYVDGSAQGGLAYYYVVRAQDTCESDFSNEATATATGACTDPPAFEGLGWAQQAAGGTCAVDLGWAPATGACGGGVSYAVYRDTNAAFAPSPANLVATVVSGTAYTDSTPMPAGTTQFYVVRATSLGNLQQDANLVRRSVTPTSCTTAAPGTVLGLSVTSRGGENLVQWTNPPGYGSVRVRFDSGVACTFPADPLGSGTLLVDDVGLPGEARSVPHTGLSDGVRYCYTLWVDTGGAWSAPRSIAGMPFATGGPVKWAFSSGVFTSTPPTVGGAGVISASNAPVVHATERGITGGAWPAGWQPYATGSPIQSRSPVIPIPLGGASAVAYLSAQDGKLHAIDAARGGAVLPLWVATLPGPLQGAPSGLFTAYLGAFNYLIVGTRITSGDNAIVALDPTTGATIGAPFTNGGAPNGIGIVNGSAAVDYGASRVYFASYAGGSPGTLWALQLGAAPVFSLAWPPRSDLGNIDGSPVLRGGRLYVGSPNLGGTLYSIDAASGSAGLDRTFVHGDGQVRDFVFPDRVTPARDLFFATDNKVWVVEDDGSTLAPRYVGGISLGAGVTPSAVLYAPGLGLVFVGGSDGRLYQIDVSGPAPVVTSVVLGDGSAAVGTPSLDRELGLVHVGTAAGVFYAVQFPIP